MKHGNISHGHARKGRASKEYITWSTMIYRCKDKTGKDYKNYAGRGIVVCERWKKFENFYKDMGKKPNGLSLDRIDNDKGYSKKNCRWATRTIQSLNRRPYGKIKLKGVHKLGKYYVSRIFFEKKRYYIGILKTAELASLAYASCENVLKTSLKKEVKR